MCSLNNSTVLKSVDEDDIEYVQNYIRHELSKEDFIEWESSALAVHLFGTFALNPDEFKFSDTEKQLLYKIATYINSYEESGKKFPYDFVLDESTTEKIESQFPVGRFFTNFSVYGNSQAFQNTSTQTEIMPTRAHILLDKMVQSAGQNMDRKPAGHRFPGDLKQFSTYIRLIGGPLTYETLHRNFEPALPSLNTVNRYIRESNQNICDGQLRVAELQTYLQKRDLPMAVSLSEDATRINGRPQYDKKSNQIYGFILPIDAEVGMPIPFSFPARNADEISYYFESNEPLAGFVNVVMAQPLADVAPFCLIIFSSANDYTTDIVINRWKFITNELQKQNISVICISSDSDPRYNSSMRKISQLGCSSGLFPNGTWFSSGSNTDLPVCIQDPPHLATKCRNQLLKTKNGHRKLRFGSRYYISIEHLERLMQTRPKDEHWLTPSDLHPVDKQNYPSVLKICDSRVINLLNKYIPESKGTAMFLQIIRDNIDTFYNRQLTPLQKIEKLWYNIFILRIWRKYVISTRNLSLEKNFLTQNCYSCFEINAHSIVRLAIYLKENNLPSNCFSLHLLDSQPCEGFFRLLRSMSPYSSIVVNFSMKEILHRVNRINLQHDITLNDTFVFPRAKNYNANDSPHFELPTTLEIYSQIEQCKLKAIKNAKELGLYCNNEEIGSLSCKLPTWKPKKSVVVTNQNKTNIIKPISLMSNRMYLKNFAHKFVNKTVDETSSYVEMHPKNRNDRMIVKKTSLCWALSKTNVKLSSDRTIRVREYHGRKVKRKQILSGRISKKKVVKIRKH